MAEINIQEKTLAEMRADAIRGNMKMMMLSPRIENALVANDPSSADIRHNTNMLIPQTPKRLAEIAEKGPFPTSVSSLMVMDSLSLEAPENLLANLKAMMDTSGGLTLRQAIASFDKQILDTDIFTPSIYRNNPQYIKNKTIQRRLVRLLLSRSEGEERERLLQWLKRTIQDVRQTFEERKAPVPQQKKGPLSFLSKR